MPSRPDRGERGVIVIWVVVLMTALMAVAAFVFDFGVLAFLQRQAQDMADAAATAAGKEYDPAITDPTPLQIRILARAQTFVDLNQPWGFASMDSPAFQPVTLSLSATEPAPGASDDVVIIGNWFFGPRTDWSGRLRCAAPPNAAEAPSPPNASFTPLPSGTEPTTGNSNAVRIRVMLENLPLFFARWLGIATGNVCADAIAVWTGVGTGPPENIAPLAFPMCIFDPDMDGTPDLTEFIGRTVRVPDGTDNTGWTALGFCAGGGSGGCDDDPNANANALKELIRCNGDPSSPCDPDYLQYKRISIGDPVYLVNGDVTSAWQEMQDYYPADPDASPPITSIVLIPVIDRDCSDPYNQEAIVVGFAVFEIRDYGGPPQFPGQHFIEGTIKLCAPDDPIIGELCRQLSSAPGGGPCLGAGCRSGLLK